MSTTPLCVYVLFTFLTPIQITDAADHPHVIYILVDDLGWNDVSYHGSDQIPTPNIDTLAYQGVMLNHHYVQPICTPSRASLMTGKHPIHTGQHWPYAGPTRSGLPLSDKVMPEYFKEMGYSTHLVGKWHLGFYKREFTPLQRGFDSHFGYWTGAMSYYDHIYQETEAPRILQGYDMRRNYSTAWDVVGQYTTDVFTREAVRTIEHNPSGTPLFLLVAHLAVHGGNPGKWLEAPQEDINRFWYISDPNRRTYAAMVSRLDQSVGEIVEALGRKDMLRNSIIVFLSDNGAPNVGRFSNWGSNYPWRGQKATLFEGGVRTPSLVWSPLIAKPSRVSTGLMHISDWLPTLLSVAGYKKPLPDIDGVDQWQAISRDIPGPRDTVLLDIYNRFQMNGIIMWPYKYLRGATPHTHSAVESGYLNIESIFSKKTPKYDFKHVLSSKAWMQIENMTKTRVPTSVMNNLRRQATISCEERSDTSLDCDSGPCLFNLAEDACEQSNIAPFYPLLRLFMEVVLNYYKAGAHPEENPPYDMAADPEMFNGTWSIWVT